MKIVKKTLKNRDILNLFNEFNANVTKEGLNPSYSFMMFKNTQALYDTVIKINSQLYDERKEPEWENLLKDRNQLYNQFADRDEQGNVIVDEKTNTPKVTEMIVEFENGLKEIESKYHDMLVRIQTKDQTNSLVLDQENEVEVVTLAISEFPDITKPFIVGLLAE